MAHRSKYLQTVFDSSASYVFGRRLSYGSPCRTYEAGDPFPMPASPSRPELRRIRSMYRWGKILTVEQYDRDVERGKRTPRRDSAASASPPEPTAGAEDGLHLVCVSNGWYRVARADGTLYGEKALRRKQAEQELEKARVVENNTSLWS